MHLGFDGLFLEQPYTGSGQYALAMLPELAARADLTVTLLRPEPTTGPPAPAGVNEVRLPCPRRLTSPRPRKVWWEQVGLPRAAARAGVDLIHVPYFAAPLFPGRPVVATIHDVIPLVLPAYAGSAAMRLYLALVSRAARGTAAVLTDSEAARADIIRHLRLAPEHVVSVPLAVGPAFRPASPTAVAATLERMGIRQPYILNAGGFDVRKNLPTLIRAVGKATAGDPTWQLVIVGQPHTGNRRLYPDPVPVVAATGLTERTVFTGFISESDKVALYTGAGLCVLPTLYEGFGLPALEAMACGAPVLASNRSSLPEVVGDAGALVDTADEAALADAISLLLADPDRRAARGQAGRTRAERFSWATTASRTVAVYRRALDGQNPLVAPVAGEGRSR